MSDVDLTVYFQSSWAILSTIGIGNVLFGLTVIGITSLSAVSLIPIVVSAAGAIANGLCYYYNFGDYPVVNSAAASAVADIMWMVQEAGISFYSYAILVRILRNRDRLVFIAIFWFLIIVIFVLRIFILISRVRVILAGRAILRTTINGLHIGYFVSIALVECLSAYFLLKKFTTAKKISQEVSLRSTLFQHLMRSTEIRLATLAIIGITRAVTYFFQPSVQKATTLTSQIDHFFYTLECLFPVMIFIDILASKLALSSNNSNHANNNHNNPDSSSFRLANRRPSRHERLYSSGGNDPPPFSVWDGVQDDGCHPEVDSVNSSSSSKQEILERQVQCMEPTTESTGIKKTVEISIHHGNRGASESSEAAKLPA
ncbi:hypothetical protein BGZ61DRAFT_526461 [Ilyonectria robusta]|uniref:uncharacterized protein n=1 Tax=Ilyonectria robusta TaxID=1079257 RepID=UPI001E8D5235|nr:uncharacterized protein BGZ61DRAFT_526461 [Ilyonectria robusta]KAH8735363.1 hypothetical protein BGZ61DRAFT_526461 [Ilyonectria robusta]